MQWLAVGVMVIGACGSPVNKAIDAAVASDAPVGTDAAAASDAPVGTDAAVGTDAPVSVDAAVAHLVVTPDHADFAAVIIGCVSSTQTVTFTSSGGTATGLLSTSLAGSDPDAFQIAADGCAGQNLPPAASCTLGVRFAPSHAGSQMAALVVASAAVMGSAALLGTGLAPSALSISPSVVDFGVVAPGTTSAPRTLTVMQAAGCPGTGTLSVALSGIDTAQFAIGADTCSGTALAGGTSCTIGVTYTAKASGTSSANLAVFASPGPTVTAALLGE